MSLLALQDLFRRHREKATGLWKLGQEPNRTVFLDSGDIVFAQSSFPTDRLTYILVERGKLTQAQMDYALANLKPGLSIGKNLIEMGFITQRDLLDVARIQVERVVQGTLGTLDLEPTFESRELDAAVVRLPLDTPRMLLNGLLNLQDRERLLELLGPLNQVVVLQGRRLMEMDLPPDLAKLPSLLDGTHTLLELSRESMAEPLRLGSFALFLREMGWARLHELPPLDRHALDLAFTPEPEPLSLPLPEPVAAAPSLFSTIEAASRPTTNLEHLTHALDSLPDLEELQSFQDEPISEAEPRFDLSGFSAESGQALLPTPALELPVVPPDKGPEPIPEPDPQVTIQPSTITPPPSIAPIPESPVFESTASPRQSNLIPILCGVLLGVAVLGFLWRRYRHEIHPVTAETPHPIAASPNNKAPEPVKSPEVSEAHEKPAEPAPAPVAEKPAPEKPVEAPPSKGEKRETKESSVGVSLGERLEAIRRGELELAARQGEKLVKESGTKHWSLRLEIACMGDTIRRAADFFPDGKPDLFLIPMVLRDGRTCYQIFYGRFPSEAAAEKQVKSLPKAFREGGNRPRMFKLSEIPRRQ